MEFKHFSPISETSPKRIAPNFTEFDIFQAKKNIPKLEEMALTGGLVAGKGLIYANTLKAAKLGKDQPLARLGYGELGFPVYSNLFIKGGTYQNNSGQTIGSYPDITINAVLFEIEHENNIITTDIQGRQGTVIEYVGSKSPKVHVLGTILTSGAGAYPHTDVKNLITALYSNRPLLVVSWFLKMVGISTLMVVRDSIKQEEGSEEYQKFEFEAFADMPVILKLSKTNIDNLSNNSLA